MSTYLHLAKVGRSCGLEGVELENFITQQQQFEREERAAEQKHNKEMNKMKKKLTRSLREHAKIQSKTTDKISNNTADTGDNKTILSMTKKQKGKKERKVLKKEKTVSETTLLQATNNVEKVEQYSSISAKLAEMERLNLPSSMLTEEDIIFLKKRLILERLSEFQNKSITVVETNNEDNTDKDVAEFQLGPYADINDARLAGFDVDQDSKNELHPENEENICASTEVSMQSEEEDDKIEIIPREEVPQEIAYQMCESTIDPLISGDIVRDDVHNVQDNILDDMHVECETEITNMEGNENVVTYKADELHDYPPMQKENGSELEKQTNGIHSVGGGNEFHACHAIFLDSGSDRLSVSENDKSWIVSGYKHHTEPRSYRFGERNRQRGCIVCLNWRHRHTDCPLLDRRNSGCYLCNGPHNFLSCRLLRLAASSGFVNKPSDIRQATGRDYHHLSV